MAKVDSTLDKKFELLKKASYGHTPSFDKHQTRIDKAIASRIREMREEQKEEAEKNALDPSKGFFKLQNEDEECKADKTQNIWAHFSMGAEDSSR